MRRRNTTPRRLPRVALLIPLALVGIISALLRGRRRAGRQQDERADTSFMRAMHSALRRDVASLETLASDRTGELPTATQDPWDELHQRLDRHHRAEDDDLWPVLLSHLDQATDRRLVNEMVSEHRDLSALITKVDRAMDGRGDVGAAVVALGSAVRAHLDHEERAVLPLIERHLSRAEWRAFLDTERRQTPVRERPEFIGWLLHEASDTDKAAVLAELPPPGRHVATRILRPRYAATHRSGSQTQTSATDSASSSRSTAA
jgi:Hemerythrin HHE cation binding domain